MSKEILECCKCKWEGSMDEQKRAPSKVFEGGKDHVCPICSNNEFYVAKNQTPKNKKESKIKTKLTPKSIIEVIEDAEYHRFPDTTITVCCLTLNNGYNVIGKSACLDPASFDQEKGEDTAREDAIRQVWELEGYLMKQHLQDELEQA